MSDFLPTPDKDIALSALKATTDVSRIFLIYLGSNGNRFRTAAASGLSVDQVDELALSEGWDAKLKERKSIAEGDSKTTDEVNREIARLQSAAQSQRLIDEINAALLHLEKLPPEDKLLYLFEVDRMGKRTPTAKFYLEIAKALETAHQCLYRALQDQMPQRPEAQDPERMGKEIGLSIANGVSKLLASNKKGAITPKK